MSQWNKWRAKTANRAVNLFAGITDQNVSLERDDVVSDLLCNLGHYCDCHGLDWEQLIKRARANLKHERHYGDSEYDDEAPPSLTKTRFPHRIFRHRTGA